jgi:hypothetical protein
MIHNDVRNNYYIYNRGSITYTGSGHANVNQNEERQLFVNTLVASYNAGTHAPAVVYKESPVETAANITTMYLPFDRSIVNSEGVTTGGIVQEDGTITVDFKTVNNNLKNNNKPLYADYYVEVGSKDHYDIKISDKYLKKVTPVSFELVTTNAEGNQTYANNDPYTLKNYQIYTMKIRIADLGLAYNTLNGINKNMVNVYVRLGTEQLATGSQKIQPSTESITPLAVYCAELFELE